MSIPIEAREVAVGDWSPSYGTVTEVKEITNKAGVVVGYNFTFFNGNKLTNVDPTLQLEILTGGSDIIHNGMPSSSQIRPGLKEDHASD